jgi:hypothetical protein
MQNTVKVKVQKKRGGGVKSSRITTLLRAKGFYLCSEIAGFLGVHASTVYRWMRNNQVEYKEVNGTHYIMWNSVIDFLGPEVSQMLNVGKIDFESQTLVQPNFVQNSSPSMNQTGMALP